MGRSAHIAWFQVGNWYYLKMQDFIKKVYIDEIDIYLSHNKGYVYYIDQFIKKNLHLSYHQLVILNKNQTKARNFRKEIYMHWYQLQPYHISI